MSTKEKPQKVKCDNCNWKGTTDDFPDSFDERFGEDGTGRYITLCPDLCERLDPGSIVPYGDCPECQCFCYLQKPPKLSKEDWVEIYYALEYKLTSPAVVGQDKESVRWQKHLNKILRILGPDGEKMWP